MTIELEPKSKTTAIRWDKFYYYGSCGSIFLHFFIDTITEEMELQK